MRGSFRLWGSLGMGMLFIPFVLSLIGGYGKVRSLIPLYETLPPGMVPVVLLPVREMPFWEQTVQPLLNYRSRGYVLTCGRYLYYRYLPASGAFFTLPVSVIYHLHEVGFQQLAMSYPELGGYQWCGCRYVWTPAGKILGKCPAWTRKDRGKHRKDLQSPGTYSQWFASRGLLPLDSLFRIQSLRSSLLSWQPEFRRGTEPELYLWKEPGVLRGYFAVVHRKLCAPSVPACIPRIESVEEIYRWSLTGGYLDFEVVMSLARPEVHGIVSLQYLKDGFVCYTYWDSTFHTYCRSLDVYHSLYLPASFPVETPNLLTDRSALCWVDTLGHIRLCPAGNSGAGLLAPGILRPFSLPALPFFTSTWYVDASLWVHPFTGELRVENQTYPVEDRYLGTLSPREVRACLFPPDSSGYFQECREVLMRQGAIYDRVIPLLPQEGYYLIGMYYPAKDSTFWYPFRYVYRLVRVYNGSLEVVADYGLAPECVEWNRLHGKSFPGISCLSLLASLHFEFPVPGSRTLQQILWLPEKVRTVIIDDYSFLRRDMYPRSRHRIYVVQYEIRLPGETPAVHQD